MHRLCKCRYCLYSGILTQSYYLSLIHFSHKGCACPTEFEGDHCEFLKEKVQVEEEVQAEEEQAEEVQADEEQAEEEQAEEEQADEEQAEEFQADEEQAEEVQAAVEAEAEESTDQHDLEENNTPTEETPSAETDPVAPLNHAKESNESNEPNEPNESNQPEKNENVQAEAPPRHDKTPPIQDQPFSKAPPVQDQPSFGNAPPVPDNTLLDLESTPKEVITIETITQSNKGSTVETNQLGGSTIALISLTVVAMIIGLLSYRRMRKRDHRELENPFVLGDNYKDETPIRVQVLSELEQPNELDEILGLDARSVEYEDDDDLLTERSECSLEEIELEYPTSEGDGEEEFDEPVQHSDRNPFAHIIGPLMRSDDGIVQR